MKATVTHSSLGIINILLAFSIFLMVSCKGQGNDATSVITDDYTISNQPSVFDQNTLFPQIHTNLGGMVKQFVRVLHQDKKGNYWFGTNGDGIIRYENQILEKVVIEGIEPNFRVLTIIEDKLGNLWFGTSEGLIQYDGKAFKVYSRMNGTEKEEIWSLKIDKDEVLWVGGNAGVSHFNGKNFEPFLLPKLKVVNTRPMLSDKLVFKIIEDQYGTMWFATDGNGIFKYSNDKFIHLTSRDMLTDNHVADILEDQKGNIWIGTFYGGVSKFNGKSHTHFTRDGIVKGEEIYNFLEDTSGNIWFTVEGHGVYRYDGQNFQQFTTVDGLTSNVILNIYEDNKRQIWFSSWQGLSIYDGYTITNASEKEPWTN